MDAMHQPFLRPDGGHDDRFAQRAFNVEDTPQREEFVRSHTHELAVPGTTLRVGYDPLPRTAVGVSRLGTSEAVAVGAYAFALQQLDR